MRHRKAGYKLGRNTSHAELIRGTWSVNLLETGWRRRSQGQGGGHHVEKLITWAREANLHSRAWPFPSADQ